LFSFPFGVFSFFFFVGFGSHWDVLIIKVDAVTIMRDPSGTSRGFAFLTFEDEEAVKGVLGRDHFLDGKAVGIII
jgi:RNA recognition motif-containing protein